MKTKMKKGLFIGSAVLAISLASTTSAFATTDPTKALKTKITQLTNQVTGLKKQVTSLTSQVTSLKKQITTLTSQKNTLTSTNKSQQTQINSLKSEVARLNKLVPTVKAGKVYQDGIESGGSNFVSMGNKQYVQVDTIIPALSTYKSSDYSYDGTNLYLGIKPSNGVVNLTKLPIYSTYGQSMGSSSDWTAINKFPNSSFAINGKKYYNGISGYNRYNDDEPANIGYKLSRKYSTLEFLLGMDDITRDGEEQSKLVVYGDDEIIYESDKIDYLDEPKSISISVKNVNVIKFEFIGRYSQTYYYQNSTYTDIVNPILIP
ncbi:hypothetical protein CN692_14235 [Bacillus sp. AFS002410]|uniref:NPCBM/NEW2 domain-containing protein n=1 Tax=Bacillus sp. AFS002410 TaxID=2033481 RepID=UPI000BEFB065|nr:NPCBM/NEW2 domain-containing protein [Bacillus sp. AFS002410]PEJ57053.1 hypothetical protein CN692_14235 [Bacillus sp. AFS002410]